MRLSEYQKKEIEKIYKNLKEELGDQKATVENLALVVQRNCSDMDYEDAFTACSRIARGAEEFNQLCKDRNALEKPDYAEDLLDNITEQMGREQRKGFFLQCLDTFEKAPLSAEDTAERAAMQEEELKALLEMRMKEFAEMAVSEMEDTLKDPCFSEAGGESRPENKPDDEDVFLFAAAEYMASLDGVLPMEFGQCPELLGICAAAQMTMIDQYEVYDGEYEEYSEIMPAILITAVSAVFAIGAAAIGIAAESVLEAMMFSSIGMLASIIIGTMLYMIFIYGCIGVIGGIVFTIEACVREWKYRRLMNQQNVCADKILHEQSGQKQEDEESKYQEVMA